MSSITLNTMTNKGKQRMIILNIIIDYLRDVGKFAKRIEHARTYRIRIRHGYMRQ